MNDQAKKRRPKVTSGDVAKHANVSQATVSRVFSNTHKVRPETAALVMTSAKKLGYLPNAIARSLSSNQTNLIAVVSVDFDNPFYQTILIKLSNMISAMGKKMLFIQSPFEQPLDNVIYNVMEYRVDGIIILSAALSAQLMSDFITTQVPVVIFNKYFDSRNFFSVCSDNIDAGELVADYFIGKGHTSFGFIGGGNLSQTGEYRFKGFSNRIKSGGFPPPVLVTGDYSYKSGYAAMMELSRRLKLPSAIFCVNDLMAFGAMDAARQQLNLRIPEDIAFVGFDNLEQSGWESYNLTSVHQPLSEMITYTENYLIEKISNPETTGGYVLLKCKLVQRNSS